MVKSCRLRDRLGGGEDSSVTQQGPQRARRRARAMTAWTCLQPSPRFFRWKSRFGPSRMMLVWADM